VDKLELMQEADRRGLLTGEQKKMLDEAKRRGLVGGAEKRGIGQDLGRQAGLSGRAIAGGLAQMVEPFTEPVRYLMNKALPGNPIGNIEAATDDVATSMGVPEPESERERNVQGIGRFATGFAGGFGGANKVDDAVMGALGMANRAKPIVPTAEGVKETANRLYKEADDSGLVIRNESFGNFVNELGDLVKTTGIDKDIHPNATAAIRRLSEAAEEGKDIKIQEFDILRRVANAARGSMQADERRIGSEIVNAMDDYMGSIGKVDVSSGNPATAHEALTAARQAWTKVSKSDQIQEAVEKSALDAGNYTGSGFENALRKNFRQIAKNSKRMRGFSPEERLAVKKIASGGTIDNAMRMLGKLAPTGIVSATLGGGAGYAVAGVPGAMAVQGIGIGARRAATKRTVGNLEDLNELVLTGKKAATKGAPDWVLPWLSGTALGTDTQE